MRARLLPVADGPRRPPLRRGARAPHPRALGAARGAPRPRRARRARRAAADRRPRRRTSRRGTTSAPWTRSSLLLAVFLLAPDRAHPLRALLLARSSASRCWPSCARTSSASARAAVGIGRVGRHRRPAHPDLPRRRPARLVGPRGACPSGSIAVVTTILTHRGRALGRLVGARSRCVLGVPPLVSGCAGTSRRAKAGYLRECRVVRRDQRHPRRDGRGRPHRRGARTRRAAAPDGSTATSRSRTRRSATRCTCARCSSPAWRSPT